MRLHAARLLIGLAVCSLDVAAAQAELRIEPASVPSGKAATIHLSAPGPGAAMLIPGGPHISAALEWPDNRILAIDAARGRAYRAHDATLEVGALTLPHDVQGRYTAPAAIAAAKVQSNEVLLTLADGRVIGLDTRDARQPQVRRQFTLPYEGYGLAVAGTHVLQATGRNELLVWDVSDPAHARLVARHETAGAVYDVDIAEGRAYVAQGDAGLLILDMQDPTRPLWLGSTGRLGRLVKLVARGDGVWVASDDGVVSHVDVFNAAQPSFSAKQRLPSSRVHALAVEGQEVWAATKEGVLRIAFDAEPPPSSNADLDVGRGVNYGGQRRADVAGDLVYVADWFSGLHIYDVADDTRPRLLASLRTPGSAKGVVVRGDYAFVADDDHGLQVVDVRDPRAPRIVANIATPGLAYTPKLVGDLLYLASHRGGFQIIDVSAPTRPKLVADVVTPGMAWSLAVADGTLYVADDAAGLLIYDVRDPAAPRALGSYTGGGRLEEVLVRKGVAYLAYFDQGLKVLDVSAPVQIRVLAELATPGNARGLDLHGDRLYVADWLAGVHAVNVADPARPRLERSYDTPGAAWGVRARADGAYVLDWWGGFAMLHLPVEGAPRLVRYAESGEPRDDAVQGDYLYVAQGAGGLQIFDIKNPLNPTWINGVELPGAAERITLVAGAAYVALAQGGLAVIDVRDPFAARLSGVVKTDRPITFLHAAGTRLYASTDGTASIYDLAKPLEPRSLGTAAGRPGEVWSTGTRVYAAADARVWRKAGDKIVELPRPASSLRGHGELLAALDADAPNALTLYKIGGERVQNLSRLALGTRLTDLAWGDGVLYAVGDMGLVTLDVSEPRHPKIVGIQEAAGIGRMIAHRGVLYSGLVALRPSPPITAEIDERGAADILLPADLAAGGYDLVYKPAVGEVRARHNALKVQTLRFSKPKITPEEFQRLLQQYRASEGRTSVPAEKQ